jgi:phosphoribosylformylglycinamidine (FGAM) synthase-like amidotransferase family enzyme
MPHPERATNALIGGTDGLRILRTLLGDRVALAG